MRALTLLLIAAVAATAQDRVIFEGAKGPGRGKRIVLISGDEEYRSEEALPELARILAKRHGFHCTVLFAIDPKDGTINPDVNNNIPGLDSLANADLMVIATRFRNLPDAQMKYIADYLDRGGPIVALRTATHAFAITGGAYKKYSWNNKDGGFGKQILGETWIRHHGKHAVQSTRGIVAPGAARHPILRGVTNIWGPADVYAVNLPLESAQTLVLGQVLEGMHPTDAPVKGPRNEPMMPVAWTRAYHGSSRVFTTTMGGATDLPNEGVRRMLVNAVYWAVGLEKRIRPNADVSLVSDYHPAPFKFGGYIRGVTPAAVQSK